MKDCSCDDKNGRIYEQRNGEGEGGVNIRHENGFAFSLSGPFVVAALDDR